MAVRVLIVDDSTFFQRQIQKMLAVDQMFEVVGTAINGQEAVEKAERLRPDVITMDVEMPVMDGITATRKIMASHPVPILMFSSLTVAGAKATLNALDAGAVDFIPKRFEEIARNLDEAGRVLRDRLREITKPGMNAKIAAVDSAKPGRATGVQAARTGAATGTVARGASSAASTRGKFHVVAIGTSTGGPIALQNILSKIPENFALPIVLVQHMPGTFTPAFAERLNQVSAIKVKEAANGDVLFPGVAYLAPGGKQMSVQLRGETAYLKIEESDPSLLYRPCIDLTFHSLAKCFHGHVLAVILTGMGADGREGARELKKNGSVIWAQDEASCVVFGMPAAVIDAGLADRVIALGDVGDAIVAAV